MDALQYLFSLEQFGIKLGLSNIQTICAALGHPQERYPCLLIAGTNGKGSVTAMVDAALRAAGLKVGRYTSPHLIRLEERFTIDGRPVQTAVLLEVVEELRELIARLLSDSSLEAPPTFFEVTTAIAFELFRRAGVGIAVLEVGLGGRLDSTNVVNPIAVAITSIDFDHEQYLGTTLAAIATEKAGVIRPAIPVIVGSVPQEARRALVSACEAAGARLIDAHHDSRIETREEDGRALIRLTTPAHDYGWIRLGLRGEHQAANAAVAVRLLETLPADLGIAPSAIADGLRDVRWPGRLQMIEAEGGRRVLLDAAHNPAGAWTLARFLKREFPRPLPMVFGAMRDKDAALMLKTLLPSASRFVMTQPSNQRARGAQELAALARQLSPRSAIEIEVEPQPLRALERAWAHCPVVCGTGSIFLVGELLDALGPSAREL